MEHKLLSKRKAYPIFSLIGFLFFFCCFTEARLAGDGNIIWTARYLLGVLGGSLALGILLGSGICTLLYLLAGRMCRNEKAGKSIIAGKGAEKCKNTNLTEADGSNSDINGMADSRRRKSPEAGRRGAWSRLEERLSATGCLLLSWLLLFLSWFPGFLAYYPAICAYDTPVQMGQIVDGLYVDHHPIAHTLLMEGFMKLGGAMFGDVNTGIAIYAVVQMLFLAFGIAAGIALLRRLHVKLPWLAGLLLLGMLFPVHMYMSVSVTKDTVFTVFVLLQLFCLYMLLHRGKDTWKPGAWDAGYLAATLGMILFRNNGRYALLVLIAFEAAAALFGRKDKRLLARLAVNSLIGFVLGSAMLSGLFRGLNAEQGDRREMLSMPIQQLSRCMLYHGGVGVLPEDDGTMEDGDKALINDFLLNEGYRHYRADISDPVKWWTNTYVVRYRTKDFAGTYLHLLGQYPGDFVNAALAVNAGYLYPGDKSHAYINWSATQKGLGYIQTRWSEEELNPWGLYKDSKWEWLHEKLEWFADSNAYLRLPVIKYLFTPGTYLWLYLLLGAYLLLHRRYRLLLPLGLVLGYYCTLFLGPTVQLRYLYPVMTALPFLFVFCVVVKGKGSMKTAD